MKIVLITLFCLFPALLLAQDASNVLPSRYADKDTARQIDLEKALNKAATVERVYFILKANTEGILPQIVY